MGEELSQLTDGAEQMHAHGRFTQAERAADLRRALFGDVTEREDGPLPIRQETDRCRDLERALVGYQVFLGRRVWRSRFHRRQLAETDIGRAHRSRPPARLPNVEASIHQNAREPHLERHVLPICGDVREHLDERVLHGLVGIVHIAEIVISDSRGAALLARHELGEPLPRRIALAGHHERLDRARELGILREDGAAGGLTGPRRMGEPERRRTECPGGRRSWPRRRSHTGYGRRFLNVYDAQNYIYSGNGQRQSGMRAG